MRRMENRFQNPIRPLRVPSDAFWTFPTRQRASRVSSTISWPKSSISSSSYIYLDDILTYTGNPGQGHFEAARWILDVLRNHGFFANLKKCRFHNDEFGFLEYVVSTAGIRMEDKRIEAVKNWPEPKSVRDIQVFIGFANFYRRFIDRTMRRRYSLRERERARNSRQTRRYGEALERQGKMLEKHQKENNENKGQLKFLKERVDTLR